MASLEQFWQVPCNLRRARNRLMVIRRLSAQVEQRVSPEMAGSPQSWHSPEIFAPVSEPGDTFVTNFRAGWAISFAFFCLVGAVRT